VAKVETNSELMLEPKIEYDDDNDNSVELITLDDDDEDYSQAGTSQLDNSQENFGSWRQMVGDQSTDNFPGQDTGAQNSQGVCCHHCKQFLPGSVDDLLLHSRKCASAYRPDKRYLYVCCICDYNNYKKSHMRVRDHIRSHLGEKPFVCEHCSSDFSRLRHLKQHISRVHLELI
jgi:hypothetical protein